MSETAETTSAAPMFRVTAGAPTPEELAAVAVVLAAAVSSGASTEGTKRRRSGWGNRARTMPGWASTSGWGNR